MKTNVKSFILLSVVLICVSTTFTQAPEDVAGWQEARWGMTSNDLQTAFKSKIKKLEKRIIPAHGKSFVDFTIEDYEIEGNRFTVFFDQDTNTDKLSGVRIRLNDEKSLISKDPLYFPVYESLLSRKFGAPGFKNDDRKREMVSLKRQWTFKTTSVELSYLWSSIGELSWLQISYMPSSSGDVDKL